MLLELGGKAPLIVLEDADLDEAVKAAAFGAFMNAGQICMSTERIIVVEAVADEFVRRLAEKAASMPAAAVGDMAGDDAAGPRADRRCAGQGRAADRRRAGDGDRRRDARHAPLSRRELRPGGRRSIRVADEEEAIRVANDSDYGLSASVFTRDTANGLKVARRIRSGICHVNGPTVQDEPQMPFGGVGASGYGRFGGKAGIDAFTELRWITIAGEPGHYPI